MSAQGSVSVSALATRGALAGAALTLTTTAVFAGGLDRSGQNVDILWKDGNYAEISGAFVMPSITGVDATSDDTGNIAENYMLFSGALRYQVNDQIAVAAVFDEPYGADINYSEPSTIYGGTAADVGSTGITVLGQYALNENISVHGGLRYFALEAEATLQGASFGPLSGYQYSGETSGTAFVVGGAYEIPAIALRAALTYTTETTVDVDNTEVAGTTTVSTTETTVPARILLNFQTGVAQNTLVFGSVQHVAWDGFKLAPAFLTGASGPLVDLTNDAITYNIGVGQRLSDQLSVAGSITYEAANDEAVSALAATDGFTRYSVGGTYMLSDAVTLGGGVSYTMLGDATADSGGSTAEFADNSGLAFGGRVGISF